MKPIGWKHKSPNSLAVSTLHLLTHHYSWSHWLKVCSVPTELNSTSIAYYSSASLLRRFPSAPTSAFLMALLTRQDNVTSKSQVAQIFSIHIPNLSYSSFLHFLCRQAVNNFTEMVCHSSWWGIFPFCEILSCLYMLCICPSRVSYKSPVFPGGPSIPLVLKRWLQNEVPFRSLLMPRQRNAPSAITLLPDRRYQCDRLFSIFF